MENAEATAVTMESPGLVLANPCFLHICRIVLPVAGLRSAAGVRDQEERAAINVTVRVRSVVEDVGMSGTGLRVEDAKRVRIRECCLKNAVHATGRAFSGHGQRRRCLNG